jgi:hypothetical protein
MALSFRDGTIVVVAGLLLLRASSCFLASCSFFLLLDVDVNAQPRCGGGDEVPAGRERLQGGGEFGREARPRDTA